VTWGVLGLVALGSYRLARLVTTDELTEGLRWAVLRRWPSWRQTVRNPANGSGLNGQTEVVPSLPVKFVNCPWCVAVWTSAGLLVADHYAGYLPSWRLAALAWPATAAAAGLLSRLGG
jgi:hypothetical protein